MVQGTFNSVDNEIEKQEFVELDKAALEMNEDLNETKITKKSIKMVQGQQNLMESFDENDLMNQLQLISDPVARQSGNHLSLPMPRRLETMSKQKWPLAVTQINQMAKLQSSLFKETDKNCIGTIIYSEHNRDWMKIRALED